MIQERLDNMAKKIITFGEIMLRLNPEGYLRFVQADKYEASFGGGEDKRCRIACWLRYGRRICFKGCRSMRSVSALCARFAVMELIPRKSYAEGRGSESTMQRKARLSVLPR